MIFRYNLDFGKQGQSMLSKFILLMFFMYFSMIDKSDMLAGLFVVMMTSSFVR